MTAAPATMRDVITTLKTHQRPALNWLVLALIATLFAAGWTLIFMPARCALAGAAALAQAMILSFYLSHDCAHLSAFPSRRQNLVIGRLLSSLSGGSPAAFAAYRRDHLRHHAEQVDLTELDLRACPAMRWPPTRKLTEALEFAYIPAAFFLLRLETLRRECASAPGQRRCLAASLAAKTLALAIIFAARPQALLWFLIAIMVRIHVIRFVDAFQHTYEQHHPHQRHRHRGWAYEQRHTFSFPQFKNFRWLNLLTLNFAYHNAHHALPHCPWYNLPLLDAALRALARHPGDAPYPYAPASANIATLLKAYHRGRIRRLIPPTADIAYDENGQFSFGRFNGVLSDHLLG